jgi:hypothetical protein
MKIFVQFYLFILYLIYYDDDNDDVIHYYFNNYNKMYYSLYIYIIYSHIFDLLVFLSDYLYIYLFPLYRYLILISY